MAVRQSFSNHSKMHYCCFCGGPATSLNLRKASLANNGDDLQRCYEDECDCTGDDCEDVDCPSQFGYNSQVLLEGDMAVSPLRTSYSALKALIISSVA